MIIKHHILNNLINKNIDMTTKRTLGGTNLKKARVSGFRARIKTAAGRAILKARRKRGRKLLTTI